MIETPEAVADAAAIAAVDGVDAVFIGPNDLAHAMGHENRWNDAPVQAAIEQTLQAGGRRRKISGHPGTDACGRGEIHSRGRTLFRHGEHRHHHPGFEGSGPGRSGATELLIAPPGRYRRPVFIIAIGCVRPEDMHCARQGRVLLLQNRGSPSPGRHDT